MLSMEELILRARDGEEVQVRTDRATARAAPMSGVYIDRRLVKLWDGACAGKQQEFDKNEEEALKICYSCPVQRDCLDYALDNKLQGVWGGRTDKQRRNTYHTKKVNI